MNTQLMFSSNSDEWETPQDLFDKLNEEFKFTMDVAATKENTKCNVYLEDSLNKQWEGTCWLNPPYSKGVQKLFVKKAYEESLRGVKVVLLIPARTDTKMWHEYIFPYASDIRFLKGRLKFSNSTNSAPFPSAIVVFGGKT